MSIKTTKIDLLPIRRDGQLASGNFTFNSGGGPGAPSSGGGSTFDPAPMFTYIDGSFAYRDASITHLFNDNAAEDVSIAWNTTKNIAQDVSILWLQTNKVNKAGDIMTGALQINASLGVSGSGLFTGALQLNASLGVTGRALFAGAVQINSSLGVTGVAQLSTVIVSSSDNAATLNYGGISKNNYVSQLTGYRISAAGEGDFRYIYADEMHVKSFIADIEQALAGGQIITKSVAKVSADFTLPVANASSNLKVEEFAGFTGAVFVNGDVIRLRQFVRADNTSLTVSDGWGTVTYVSRDASANPTTQSYTFTRSASPNSGTGSGVVKTGTLALDYGTAGQGLIETTTVDGMNGANSPYQQVLTWTGHPATGLVLKYRAGNLAGITDADFGTMGYGVYTDSFYGKGKFVLPNAGMTNEGTADGSTRFYAGSTYANRASAPFMVTQAGDLTAKGVTELGTSSTYYGGYWYNMAIKGSEIYETGYPGNNSVLYINQKGYQGTTTYFRSTVIGNGKDQFLAYFQDIGIELYKNTIIHGTLACSDVSISGTISAGTITATGYNSTNWDTAYSHSQNNSQAHSDYLINNGSDTTSGSLTATNFILSSDLRLKENVKPLRFKSIPIKYKEFNLISEPEQKRVGCIAQEIEVTNPEFVRKDKDGMLSVAYIDLLMAKVAELENRLRELESR